MLPEQPTSYPIFVADQLLTAENLNDLFGYLDMQERGTRINLIGLGIVCGLELTVNSAGTEIVIGKGCGITSSGYLVRWDETRFANYKPYNAAKELVYAPFYGNGAQRFPIDELKATASDEGIQPLNAAYLADKAVLMFVELLRSDNKNCDPESCDDKGSNVNYTLRPLLLRKSDAAGLSGGLTAGTGFQQSWWQLPEMRMPRHHLPAGDVYDSGDVFEGFIKVLSSAFIKNIQGVLTGAWSKLQPLLSDLYPNNPFTGISSDFAFLNNGQLSPQQLLYTQYYYDLFSDLIAAYDELRQTGNRLLTLCCPDETLFPRHLLLGAAAQSTSSGLSPELRHGFFQSPAMGQHGSMVRDVRLLFRRIVLLLEHFNPEAGTAAGSFATLETGSNIRLRRGAAPIRITPSRLGPEPLSEQAIPFYYNAASGNEKLYQHWSVLRSNTGSVRHILSYHNALYNTGPQAVPEALKPLSYDLENYNFLRIEGHVGRRYTDALAQINTLRDTNRLPFDVVALSSDIKTLRETLALIANSTNNANLKADIDSEIGAQCHFQDLEALYDTLAQGLLCQLTKEMKYYYALPRPTETVTADKVPTVPLLVRMDPAFRYRTGSVGDRFEQLWKVVAKQAYITPEQFFGGSFTTSILGTQNRVSTNAYIPFLALLYYIERLSEVLTTTLISFNVIVFQRRYTDLMTVAKRIKDMLDVPVYNDNGAPEDLQTYAIREDLIDHLDALLYACKDAQFMALYNDYKIRWVYIAMLQKFGYYVKMHPAMQHKAGVTMGGTFVMVYHERSRLRRGNTNIFTRVTAAADAARNIRDLPDADERVEDLIRKQMQDRNEETKSSKRAGAANDDESEDVKRAAEADDKTEFRTQTSLNAIPGSVRQLHTSKLKATLSARQLDIIDRLFYKDLITRHNLDELTAELPDQIVIADFYLPYMCCSDCPPIYYIVNERKDDTDPVVSLAQNQFCNADKTDYPVTVNPAGGTLTGEGTRSENGSFVFNPAAVSISTDALNKVVTLTYKVEEETGSFSLTVFAKPKAGFEFLQATAFNVISVRSTSTQAATLSWDFGDGSTGSGANTFHTYKDEGTYTVTLTATNGVCSDKISQTITISRASLSLEASQFCSADKRAYGITVNPQGGKVTGEAVDTRDGQWFFRPAGVVFGKEIATKDVTLSYGVEGQTAQTIVKVFQTPTAAFSVTDSPAAANVKIFRSANAFPASYQWDFGDGTGSQEVTAAHQYQKPGTYVVTLTVTNGPCKDSSSQTVTMQTVAVSLSPDRFCSADKQSYPIKASPAGGQAGGEAVVTVSNGFEFRPGGVVFNTAVASKTVTITYNVAGVSAQTQVEVFQTPSALFSSTPGTASALERRFTAQNPFNAEYAWDFGDGEGSKEKSPAHIYKKAGDYEVTLQVVNSSCEASHTETITVGKQEPQKSCAPLNGIIKSFNDLPQSDPARFKIFKELFSEFGQVATFFTALADVSSKSIPDQIQFFIQQEISGRLNSWFKNLQQLVVSSDVRDMALRLWNILADLAAYIMCIQSGDYDKNQVNLQNVYKSLTAHYRVWGSASDKWSAAERQLMEAVRTDIVAEIARVNSNGEAGTKAQYLQDLNTMLQMLSGASKK